MSNASDFLGDGVKPTTALVGYSATLSAPGDFPDNIAANNAGTITQNTKTKVLEITGSGVINFIGIAKNSTSLSALDTIDLEVDGVTIKTWSSVGMNTNGDKVQLLGGVIASANAASQNSGVTQGIVFKSSFKMYFTVIGANASGSDFLFYYLGELT